MTTEDLSDDLIKRLQAYISRPYIATGTTIEPSISTVAAVKVYINPDGPEAAATIASLRAELARAKEDGVRAYTNHCITCAEAAEAQLADARAAIIRAQAMDDLIAADADMIDYVPVADSDGDDGA